MKISDEIRRWADDLDSYDIVCTTATLCILADRIDSEMVELPKDADGVPIHVGDKVYLDDGRMACVTSIEINDVCEVVDCWDGGKHVAYHPSGISHTRHDSFESIADELDLWCNSVFYSKDECSKPHDFAERIRRLAAKENER